MWSEKEIEFETRQKKNTYERVAHRGIIDLCSAVSYFQEATSIKKLLKWAKKEGRKTVPRTI